QSRGRTNTNYYTAAGDFDHLTATSTELEEEKIEEPVRWIGHKEKFFTSALISSEPFASATLKNIPADVLDSSVVKTLESTMVIPEKAVSGGLISMQLFFGPNDLEVLKHVTEGFDRNLELGWGPFTWINKWIIIPVFDFLDNYLSNFGIIIILLVLFIKTILFPLTYKSYLSMAKMRVLKPELDAIKEKHGGDLQKSQQESMQLYSKMGVNPVSGCIPVLLSMPILLAMFNFFPNSIELRQEAFLWANDLSTYDVFARLPFTIPFYGSHVSMFTLLMTASTILYTWSNNQVSTMQGPMVFMSYIMPLVFLFVLNSFPAGLSFYYLISNLVTFGQQAAIR
ncbi:MAG: membrane protein insertase YidC, partial [Sphingobacteriales bacterium]